MTTVSLRRDRLEALCAVYGLPDQQRLAEHMGLNASTVSRVLAQPPRSGPSALFIACALTAFKVPFEHLFEVAADGAAKEDQHKTHRVPA